MKKLAFVDSGICVACGVCMGSCPRSAIAIDRGCFARVDLQRCVGCGLCAKACPAGCITLREGSNAQ